MPTDADHKNYHHLAGTNVDAGSHSHCTANLTPSLPIVACWRLEGNGKSIPALGDPFMFMPLKGSQVRNIGFAFRLSVEPTKIHGIVAAYAKGVSLTWGCKLGCQKHGNE
jgi:hypothetical protein